MTSVISALSNEYGVFDPDPAKAAAQNIAGPGAGNGQSPNGWLVGAQNSIGIQGNNVHAYLNSDGAAGPDAGGAVIGTGIFTANADLLQEPDVPINRAVSVQNLFYWNNKIHDELYRHGFTEVEGNFQINNFGNGGAGNDAVIAESQIADHNNAFFATPPDGTAPKMTMYIWTNSTPRRDSALDSDLIWHEYGHGLTWRMIGNMGGSVSGGIGEGMSDTLAIIFNDDDVFAEYADASADGIRSHRYGGYPNSLNDFVNGGSPHNNGEIYAAAIWKLWEIAQNVGLSRDRLMDHLIDGLRFTPQDPDYLDMRNGILQSTPAQLDCWVWEAFAEFGMGDGALFAPLAITESNAVPPGCAAGPRTPPTFSTTPEYCPSVKDVQRGRLTPGGNKRFVNFKFTDPRMDQSKRHATRFKNVVVEFSGISALNVTPQDSQAYCSYLTGLRDANNNVIVLLLESDKVRNVEDTSTSLRFVSDPPSGRYFTRHGVNYEYKCRHKHNTCAF